MSATKEKLHNEIEKGMRKLQIVNFIDKKFSEIYETINKIILYQDSLTKSTAELCGKLNMTIT